MYRYYHAHVPVLSRTYTGIIMHMYYHAHIPVLSCTYSVVGVAKFTLDTAISKIVGVGYWRVPLNTAA